MMKRAAGIIALVALAAAGIYGYKLLTGKVRKLDNVKAEETISASQLIAAFVKDSASANRKYLGKILLVTGNIKNIEKGYETIVLGDAGNGASVRCAMDTSAAQKIIGLNVNDSIAIKGACTGFNADELGIGSDVVLNRCVIAIEGK